MNKKNAFNGGDNLPFDVVMLPYRVRFRPHSSNFAVIYSLFFYHFLDSPSRVCVSCSFLLLQSESCAAALFSSFFSGPFSQSTLGVVFPSSFVSSVVPFDLCCAQLFSPLIIRCLSHLKKNLRSQEAPASGLVSVVRVSVRGRAKQIHYPLPPPASCCIIIPNHKLKMINSCFLCAIASS